MEPGRGLIRRTRMKSCAAALALLCLATCSGCAERSEATGSSTANGPSVQQPATLDSASAPEPKSTEVTCPGPNQVSATMDYLEPPEALTIESSIQSWTEQNPDLSLFIDERKRAADVYLVRPNGSVAAALNILQSSNDGWALNTFTSCPGVPPFGR